MQAVATEPLPRFACPDWWDRLQAGETPMADVPVNARKAAEVVTFFDMLKLPDGPAAGTPLREACGEWFRDILVAFLASEDPETGARLVWECLCEVPKKNSKTTYTAALGLTALYCLEATNGQMLLIGPSQNIADRCFEQAERMIAMDEGLKKIFVVQSHKKKITRFSTGTELEVKTFDTTIVTGEIPLLTIVDELHELGKKKGALHVMQQIRGGGITQAGGLLMMITTQSDRAPAGIWRSELAKARAIRDGRGGKSPILLPVLYEFPEKLQKDEAFWRDTKNWPLVLPNLDRSINRQRLLDDYENNGSASPEAEQVWVSQHLNIEIGLGLHENRWLGADHWEAAGDPGMTLNTILETSEVCTIGIDPGGYDDLLGLALIGRHRETGVWQHWGRCWADRVVLERRKSIAEELADFEEQGDLVLVDDLESQGYDDLAEFCVSMRDSGLLPEENAIGIDMAGKAASLIVDALLRAGFPSEAIRRISQGYTLTNIAGACVIKLDGRRLMHCDQPMMSWAVGNAKLEARGSAEYITKAVSGASKIDPLMALFDAGELMALNPAPARAAVLSIPDNYEVA